MEYSTVSDASHMRRCRDAGSLHLSVQESSYCSEQYGVFFALDLSTAADELHVAYHWTTTQSTHAAVVRGTHIRNATKE